MTVVYRFVAGLAAFILLVRAGIRGLWDGAQSAHWQERLGWVKVRVAKRPIWVHAVSVGEVRTAHLLIGALKRENPEWAFVLSVTTVTGRREAHRLWHNEYPIVYFPYDLSGAVCRFLDRIQPAQIIIIETEIWPTLYRLVARRGIPLTIANAKLSVRSVRRWQRFKSVLPKPVLHHPWVFAQSHDDAQRFIQLGFDRQKVLNAGQMKLAALHAKAPSAFTGWSSPRPIWIAGSTRDGEEELCLAAHRLVLNKIPNACLIIAPRHPERFEMVANLVKSQFYDCAQRSKGDVLGLTKVALLDTIGELPAAWSLAMVGLVGGTVGSFGGHNPLELVAQHKAVVVGPHYESIRDLIDPLVNAQLVDVVMDASSLSEVVIRYLSNPEFARVQGRAIYDHLATLPSPLPLLLQHLSTTAAHT